MNALVLGSHGMAGHMIAGYLMEHGWNVTGFARQSAGVCPTVTGDAENYEFVADLIRTEKYRVVINAIGVLNQFVDKNPERGTYLNAAFPHRLAVDCHEAGCRLIHISTDCVFSGDKGAYTESDEPDACSLYGRTKMQGEVIDDENLTIRTSIVGPELKKYGIGLYHWFMQQDGQVNGYRKVVWSGVTTLELAKFIEQVASAEVTGLWHLSNNASISKYDLLCLFNRYARRDEIAIHPVDLPVCDKSLLCTRRDFSYVVPSYEEMMQEMGDWMRQHREWYSQYRI